MLAYHTCESGQASGTVVTPANSAVGGTGFTATNVDTILGAALTYYNVRPRGALSIRCTTGGLAAVSHAIWDSGVISGAPTTLHFRCVLRAPAVALGMSFLRFRSGGSQIARFTFSASGQLQIRRANNSVEVPSTLTIGPTDWLLVRGTVVVGTTGSAVMHIHTDRTSQTPTETLTVPSANFGTTGIDEASWGIVGALLNCEVILDDMVVTTDGLPGPAEQTRTMPSDLEIGNLAGRTFKASRAAVSDLEIADVAQRGLKVSRAATSGVAVAEVAVPSGYPMPRLTDGWAIGKLMRGHFAPFWFHQQGQLDMAWPGPVPPQEQFPFE